MAEDYARDFETSQHRNIELISLDSREGDNLAKLYDIMQNPSLLVIRDDGQLLKHWEGVTFPVMSEVTGYLLS